jgi:hypothetical protein
LARAARLLSPQTDGTTATIRTWRYSRGQPTPDLRTNLQPGERVRLKDHVEILATVNVANKNRGLSFDPEMSIYCGGEYTVAARVDRIINERTGEMMEFSNPCIRLEGAVCNALYSQKRHLCPRRIASYFREIWLDRVPGNAQTQRVASSDECSVPPR